MAAEGRPMAAGGASRLAPDLLVELGLFRRIQVVAVTVLADVHNNVGRHRGELASDCLERLGDGQNQMRLRGVGDRVHTNRRLQRCRPSASHTKQVTTTLASSCDAGCTGTLPGGAGVLLPLALAWDCAGFAGEAFACLERPCAAAGRGLLPCRRARRHRGPRLRRLRPGEARHGRA